MDEEPGGPQDVAGDAAIGPAGSPVDDHGRGDRQGRGRQEPADLAAELVVQHPKQAGDTAERPAARSGATEGQAIERRPETGTRGPVAEEPAEAVIAKEELQRGVRLAAPDVRPAADRQKLEDRDPPAAGKRNRHAGREQAADPAPKRHRRADEPDHGEGWQDEPSLEVLRQEAGADEGCGEERPPEPAVFEASPEGPGRAHEQKGEEGIGVVVPEDQDRDRRDGHDHAGEERRRRAKRAADREVQDDDGGDPEERFRGEDRPRAQSEGLHRQAHERGRQRWLVERDEALAVERPEEERRPALARGLGSHRVVAVGIARDRHVDEVQGPRQAHERRDRERARPDAAERPPQAARRRGDERRWDVRERRGEIGHPPDDSSLG